LTRGVGLFRAADGADDASGAEVAPDVSDHCAECSERTVHEQPFAWLQVRRRG